MSLAIFVAGLVSRFYFPERMLQCPIIHSNLAIMSSPADYIVYILRCSNSHLYTGYTNDLTRRYKAHLAGQCKYTRSFKPVAIAQHWLIFGEKKQALQVERYIKSLSRSRKEALVLEPQQLLLMFDCCRLNSQDLPL